MNLNDILQRKDDDTLKYAITTRLATANIPRRYSEVTLTNASPKSDQSAAYDIFNGYATTFDRGTNIKSLYLYSASPGTGKTTSACALINEYIFRTIIREAKAKRPIPTSPAYFLDVNALQTKYNLASMSSDADKLAEVAAEIERTSYVEFAVLDDVGVRSATQSFRSLLHSAINHRVSEGLPTVYTSNLPISELATVYDERLADRLREQTVEVAFKGESKRGRR